MLQQTQVIRVIPKFDLFRTHFPTVHDLAAASLHDVLAAWSGLGYNRRGMMLRESAQIIVNEHAGVVPRDPSHLIALPGIGPNTAGSIAAFAYNDPTIFIETNIRAVFLHHFFPHEDSVSDARLMQLIAASLDRENPRHWYYALMDYGSHLKQTIKNPNVRSKHYTRQSKFQGSMRQLRGAIIRMLTIHRSMSRTEMHEHFPTEKKRLEDVIAQLSKEGFICESAGTIRLS